MLKHKSHKSGVKDCREVVRVSLDSLRRQRMRKKEGTYGWSYVCKCLCVWERRWDQKSLAKEKLEGLKDVLTSLMKGGEVQRLVILLKWMITSFLFHMFMNYEIILMIFAKVMSTLIMTFCKITINNVHNFSQKNKLLFIIFSRNP